MHIRQPLPSPSPQALEHSKQLLEVIRETIHQSGGSISFRQYMHMALYEPGLGYYVAGLNKFGQQGDFVTAPEISPLFSQCLAHQIAPITRKEETNQLLEFGAGSGIMAADILGRLEQSGALPVKYLILDLSPELQQRQRNTIEQHTPHLLKYVRWIKELPVSFSGVILANEVLDAMPVELFSIERDTIKAIHVTTAPNGNGQTGQTNQHLTFTRRPPDRPDLLAGKQCFDLWDKHYSGYRPAESYTSEYNPTLSGWLNSLNDILRKGLILLIDYGYERKDYYRPERNAGTLLCHYQHHVHDNPLLWPGLQDITASVDFTAVAEATDTIGLDVAFYMHQGDFLINNNLEDLFNHALANSPEQPYQLAQQIRTLTLPSEMGERFKAIGLTKGFTSNAEALKLTRFNRTDRRHRL